MKILNNFSQGKMDKELSGRILPKGVYRDLLNGRVSSSDFSNVGIVQSLNGTSNLPIPSLPVNFNIIGMRSHVDNIYYIATDLVKGSNIGTGVIIGEYNKKTNTHSYVVNEKRTTKYKDLDLGYYGYDYFNSDFVMTSSVNVNINGSANVIIRYRLVEAKKDIKPGDKIFTLPDSIPSPEHGMIPQSLTLQDGSRVSLRFVERSLIANQYIPLGNLEDKEYDISYVADNIYSPIKIKLDKDVVVANMEVFEGMLIFCDYNNNEPYKINIEKAKADYDNYYINKDSVKVVKAPPFSSPEITVIKTNEFNSNASFNDKSFQFASRYHYNDGEISAISPYSEVAFDSQMKTIANNTPHLVYVSLVGNEIKIGIKDVNKTGDFIVNKFISDDDSIAFDYVRIDDHNFKVAILRNNHDLAKNKSDITLTTFNLTDTGILTNKKTTNIYTGTISSGRSVKIVPKSPSVIYASICTYNTLMLYKTINGNNSTRVIHISSNGQRLKGESVCVSDIGDAVYFGYNDELYKHTPYGTWGVLHVDENTDAKDKNGNKLPNIDIFKQGAVASVCCSADGEKVYALVFNRSGYSEYKVIASDNGGRTWSIPDNVEKCSGGTDSAIIQTDEDGDNVIIAYVSGNKVRVNASVNRGELFEGEKSYSKGVKYIANTLSLSLSKNGDVAYIGFVDTSGHGAVIKTDDKGANFTEVKTIADVIDDEGKFFVKSDLVAELANNKQFIENDINGVIITPNSTLGDPQIKYVEILARDTVSDAIYSIEKKDANDSSAVSFFNDTSYKLIPNKDVNKLYDNVPLKARTFSIIQNTLIFGGYTDGYSFDDIIDVDIKLNHTNFKDNDNVIKSLKHGVSQSYAIIYYDNFGRSSDAIPVGVKTIPKISNIDAGDKGIVPYICHASIVVSHTPPLWATSYCIAKKPPLLDYEIVDKFDDAKVYDDKLYLNYTSYGDLGLEEGGQVELISSDDSSINVNKVSIKVESVIGVSNSKLASDGTTIALPAGKYIVVNPSDVKGYTIADNTKFKTSVFYIHKQNKPDTDKIYRELPRRFKIVNGLHMGNIENQDGYNPAIINLDYDWDVLIPKDSKLEIYKISKNRTISNLGRPNLDSDNFRQIDRYASMCASEVYVDDTNFNGFSSFNLSLVNYKDLDKKNGSIRLIDSEDTNVEVYQRDRVSKVMYKKNILSMADGKQAISQSQDIWGEQQKYASEYGLSHPSSFAKWGNSKYFTDANRGVIIRKANNGIAPISLYGMNDYIHDLLENNNDKNIKGYYEPEYNLYHIVIGNENIAFSEKSNGWEFRCDLIPDAVINDDFNTYSFKGGKLYKHNTGEPNKFYDVEYELSIESYMNDNPDIVKIYNAIQINGDRPQEIKLETMEDSAIIANNLFEKREECYFSHVPTGESMRGKDVFIAGIVFADNTTDKKSVRLDSLSDSLKAGDPMWIYDPDVDFYSIGSSRYIGTCTSVNKPNITLNTAVNLIKGKILISVDNSNINGSSIRDRFVKSTIIYAKGKRIEIESYVLDVDISKQ